MDIETFNADWLKAWSDKNVDGLVSFYTGDATYMDPQTTAGIHGHDALRTYLTTLFGSTPPTIYTPEEVWAVENGFCGRWYADIGNGAARLRGFDLVLLRDGLIAHNEVYVHQL